MYGYYYFILFYPNEHNVKPYENLKGKKKREMSTDFCSEMSLPAVSDYSIFILWRHVSPSVVLSLQSQILVSNI